MELVSNERDEAREVMEAIDCDYLVEISAGDVDGVVKTESGEFFRFSPLVAKKLLQEREGKV